jgi:hypothetical protein
MQIKIYEISLETQPAVYVAATETSLGCSVIKNLLTAEKNNSIMMQEVIQAIR